MNLTQEQKDVIYAAMCCIQKYQETFATVSMELQNSLYAEDFKVDAFTEVVNDVRILMDLD